MRALERGLRGMDWRFEVIPAISQNFCHERILAHREAMIIANARSVIIRVVDDGQHDPEYGASYSARQSDSAENVRSKLLPACRVRFARPRRSRKPFGGQV